MVDYSLSELESRLYTLNELGLSLSLEKDFDTLLNIILMGAKKLSNADAGTLYTLSEDGKFLDFSIVINDYLGIHQSKKDIEISKFPQIPLYLEDGSPNEKLVVAYSALKDKVINIVDVYNSEELGFEFLGTHEFDERTGYISKSFITVPLKDHENTVIGVLQLLNAKDPITSKVISFTNKDLHLITSLASQAAISMTNNELIYRLKELLESFIQVLADAIDAKSPYTGEHCRRVPILSGLIADAMNLDEEGELGDLKFSENELYELYIASLLHDCGKVVTPVHVVDKSTKLETIYDRIGLLELRFDSLRKDLEKQFLEKKIAFLEGESSVDLGKEKKLLELSLFALEEDKERLRKCNIGTESMEDEDIDWVNKLADKVLDYEGRDIPFLTNSEVENLTIKKGTLTDKERDIINNHVSMTIEMLEPLRYPSYLKNVPEIAGGHHERVDGKGYPRGLKGDEMSIQAKILALADVFEALTGKGRPYKKTMTLSKSLNILKSMKEEGHIDSEIYDVFIRQKVPFLYAENYLEKSQIDIDSFQ